MAARPRRVAAQKANTAITDMADSEIGLGRASDSIVMSSRPSRRSDARSPPERSRVSNTGGRSSGISSRALGRESFTPGEIVEGKRNRSQRKSYRVDSSEDDDPDAEGEADDDDMMDADGEIVVDADMDVDAEGEEDDELDAEGEDDMDVDPKPPARQALKAAKPAPARHSIPSKGREPARASTKATAQHDDSDDEELSDLDSDADEIQDTVNVGGGEQEDDEEEEEDDDNEEEEEDDDDNDGAGGGDEDEEEEEPRELDSDDEGSDGDSPDLDKMTKRQRARFADEEDGALLKLSDEVQAKKVFTAEELSMRRAEMARRRRNLSEKRNEEVKMETIHKLLHKQAPKTNRKQLLAEDQARQAVKPDAVFVRWVNNKSGSVVAVPDEMLAAPPGRVFTPGGLKSGKMVEEVS